MELTIRIKEANLSQKEQAVVEKILSSINQTVFLSGGQLAEVCDVSPTFITRLVHKLGYVKFSEFKVALEEQYRRVTSPYDMFQKFSPSNGIAEVVKRSFIQDVNNLNSMEKLLDLQALEAVVSAIHTCQKVYLVAMFASEMPAHLMGHYLWRLGKPYEILTGLGVSKKIEFCDIGSNDVLIAFSSQRVLKEVRDVARISKSRGAVTVAITDNAANPLACCCDYVMLAPVAGLSVDYTHVATLAMVNLIINCLAMKNHENVKDTLSREVEHCSSRDLFCL